ncbi:hypothetical protein ACLB1G_21650 [Oxalobacteraceae bacterium A2-2]
MRTLLIATTMAAVSALPAAHAEDYQDRSVIGRWRLVSVLDFAEISCIDEREAKRLVGKVMTVSAEKLKLGTRTCSSPGFQAERVDPEQDLREKAHASAKRLHLPDPVTVVELSCAYVYVRDHDHLVLDWEGAFFDAVRVK